MFSISDIKQEAYPAAYRRGKELYERGLVQEFSYDVYTEDGVPKAELIGRVKGTVEDHYDVRLVIDEEYAEVSESRYICCHIPRRITLSQLIDSRKNIDFITFSK